MRRSKVWFLAIAGAAAALVVVTTIVSAKQQGSWGPVESMAWFPAVLVAVAGSGNRACRLRRGPRP
jgi:intracellular septation protein A